MLVERAILVVPRNSSRGEAQPWIWISILLCPLRGPSERAMYDVRARFLQTSRQEPQSCIENDGGKGNPDFADLKTRFQSRGLSVGSCVSLGRHSCPKSVWLGALCPDRAPGRLPLQGVWGRGACKIFLKPRRWPIGSMHATSEEIHAEKPAMQHHHAACLSRQLCSDSTECECEKRRGEIR